MCIDPNPSLPDEAYDVTGKVKPEYMTSVVLRAYPEKHSVWYATLKLSIALLTKSWNNGIFTLLTHERQTGTRLSSQLPSLWKSLRKT